MLLMGSNQLLVLMLFARSSTSTRARPPSQGSDNNLFLKNAGIQTSSTRTETSQRECFRNSLLLNRKVPLPSSIKWMNWRERQKRLKGSLRNTRNDNRRSTTISVSYAHALALLIILSLQLLWLDAVNICGLMCWLMCHFNVWTHMPIWSLDSYANLMCDTLSMVCCWHVKC